jgi:Flp pilus assembly protein TadG
MKMYNQIISKFKEQRGVTAVVVAIAIVMLMGFVALAVDVGFVAATKNELQNVADSAALAGTELLGNIYTGKTKAQMDVYNCSTAGDCASIIARAQGVVGSGKNKAGGEDIVIDSGDVIIGKWDGNSLTFTPTNGYPGGAVPDAVKVTARRDSTGGGNGPISTFFAKIFGFNTVDVKADAIADLSGLSKVGPGGLPIPIGISKYRFTTEWCDKPIKLQPSNDPEACAGWHTYDDPNGKIKVELLPGLIDGSFTSPEANGGDIFFYNGGTNDAAFVLFEQLFDQNKVLNDGVIDGDTDPTTWTTTVVVYDWDDCSNPNTDIPIVGFAKIVISDVCHASKCGGLKQITAVIACDYIESQRGGGGEYGIIGSIAGLVE